MEGETTILGMDEVYELVLRCDEDISLARRWAGFELERCRRAGLPTRPYGWAVAALDLASAQLACCRRQVEGAAAELVRAGEPVTAGEGYRGVQIALGGGDDDAS